MVSTEQTLEDLTLTIHQEIHVQASLDITHRTRAGGTPFCSNHREASMPVLPDPMTVYREKGRRIFGSPFTGIRATFGPTSYLGGWVAGISVLAWVASTSLCARK